MSRAFATRIERFRSQPRIRAGSLITTVFGDAILPRGGRIWLGSLIRLLEPLGLNDRLVRTSVFRLAKEEWLYADACGRKSDYVLTRVGQRRFEEASRQIYALRSPHWDRHWRLIVAVGDFEARQRDRLRQSLFWQGFGSIAGDCFVHPSADLRGVFDTLAAEGLGELLPQLMPLVTVEIPPGSGDTERGLVRRAWNLDALGDAYDEFIAACRPLERELSRMSRIDDEQAFLVRILLIHDYRRLLLRDPELPDVLLPGDWPGHRARQLCAELYRRLLEPSERHLDRHLLLASGATPVAGGRLAARFSEN